MDSDQTSDQNPQNEIFSSQIVSSQSQNLEMTQNNLFSQIEGDFAVSLQFFDSDPRIKTYLNKITIPSLLTNHYLLTSFNLETTPNEIQEIQQGVSRFFCNPILTKCNSMIDFPIVSTGIPPLDSILSGGYPKFKLTEIIGSDADKTIFLFYFIFYSIISAIEDPSCYSIPSCWYIHSKKSFSSAAIVSVLNTWYPDIPESTFSRVTESIRIVNSNDVQSLMACLNSISRVSILVIDSLSDMIETEKIMSKTTNNNWFIKRHELLFQLATLLKYLGERKSCTILVGNTDGSSYIGRGWGHSVNTRIQLESISNKPKCILLKSPVSPQKSVTVEPLGDIISKIRNKGENTSPDTEEEEQLVIQKKVHYKAFVDNIQIIEDSEAWFF